MFDLNQHINEIAKSKGWKAIPLKYIYKRKKELGDGSENLLSIYRDHGVVPKNSRSDNFNKASDDLNKYQKVQPGDLVINKMKAWQGSVAISDYDGIISPAYFIYEPQVEVCSRYIHYLLRSEIYFSYYASISSGVRPNQWDLDPSLFERINLLLPPFDEQKRIADELDRELAEIDEFIADQERLQALTEEQYYSQLHQLVTKGVGKSPELIDSNFDWIGSIPSQWTLQKIGWLFNDIGSGTTPSTSDESAFEAGTINWVTTGELRENGISTTKHQINQETLSRYSALKIHPANSILIAMYGATIGRLGWLEEPATTNQAVCVLSNPTNVLPKYAFYALITARQHIFTLASGGGQPNINQDIIRNLKVPVPPIEEQEIIIKKLDITYLQLGNSIRDFALLRKFLDNKKNSIIYSILQTQRTGKK